jgi:hypothetical protein
MSGELEAAGTAIEGALLGAAIDNAGNAGSGAAGGACLNCGAQLSGPYCVQCGQHAHVHRTLAAIWHDILHSVLHFDGKFWRTLPLLALRPGELTRRYIAGERAKFVSPMALFLFSIFLMFAVFSFIGSPFSGPNGPDLQRDIAQQATQLDKDIAVTQNQIADPKVPAAAKIGLKAKLNDLKGERNGIALIQTGKVKYRDADSLVAISASPRSMALSPASNGWMTGYAMPLKRRSPTPAWRSTNSSRTAINLPGCSSRCHSLSCGSRRWACAGIVSTTMRYSPPIQSRS